MPEGAIYVGRPSRWGNEYLSGRMANGIVYTADECVGAFEIDLLELSRARRAEYLALLRGHDLACWCPLDAPCHADVLLRLANE